MRLQGVIGTFTYQPYESVYPVAATLTVAATAYAMSTTMSIGGWTPSTSTGLRPGQYIQVGTQLLRLAVAPSTADGAGKATVEFYPPLRSDFAIGSSVITSAPKGLFRLASGESGSGFQIDPDKVAEFTTLQAVEAI